MRDGIEMGRSDRRSGKPGDRRGQENADHRARPAGQERRFPVAQRVEDGDQRGGRGKGHLEPRSHQRLRPQQQDQRCRDGDRPQRQGAPPEDQRGKSHRHHDEGALRRDVATGQGEVDAGRHQRAHRRDPLRRPHQRQPGYRRQDQAQEVEDHRRQQTHVQPRNGEEMGKIAGPQRLKRVAANRTAVTGRDGRRKSTGIAGQLHLDIGGHGHSDAKDQQVRRAVLRFCHAKKRHPAVAHRAQTREPCVALKVEPAGFNRPGRRRQVRGCHHPQSRHWHDATLGIPVQGQAHPVGCPARRHILQPHPVQRQPQRVRLASVDGHDPPLHRTVVPPSQDRTGKRMGPRPRDEHAGEAKRHADEQGCCRLGRVAREQQAEPGKEHYARENCHCRLRRQREIGADAHPKADRHPAQEMPALLQKLRQRPPAKGVNQSSRPAHACPRSLHWIDRRQSLSGGWLANGKC